MTLNNDGTGIFSGEMHDSGFPDYDFTVRAVVRSASGRVAVVGQKSGSVKGSVSGAIAGDDPARTFAWNDPVSWNLPKFAWSDIRAGSMAVSKSYELSGVLGTLSDLLYNVLDFVISLGVTAAFPGGAAVVSLVFMGSELSKIYGIRVVGPGGLVGVASEAGSVLPGRARGHHSSFYWRRAGGRRRLCSSPLAGFRTSPGYLGFRRQIAPRQYLRDQRGGSLLREQVHRPEYRWRHYYEYGARLDMILT